MATYAQHKAGQAVPIQHSSKAPVRVVNGQGLRPADRYGRRNDRPTQMSDVRLGS